MHIRNKKKKEKKKYIKGVGGWYPATRALRLIQVNEAFKGEAGREAP